MSDRTIASTLVFGCVLLLFISRRILAKRRSHPLPPGPPGLPWIGNIIGIDASAPWRTYAHWSKTYGDIVYTKLMGKDIIIINSEKIARDLFEERSKNYSDRPRLSINEIYGLSFATGQIRYGDVWRMHRRFFHQTFRLDAVSRFRHLQHRKSCRLLRQSFDAPEQFNEHVFEYIASLSLNAAYDYDPSSRKDEIVDTAANLLDIVAHTFRPDTAIILDAFPFLFNLPTWLPGMSFKKDAEKIRAAAKEYVEWPFEYSLQKANTSGNSAAVSMVYDELQTKGGDSTRMVALKEASATAFVGASETSNSVLLTFLLMMMLNPDVQEKAQAQVDAVVDKGRLPTLDDRPLLPFIDAIFREIFRHSPVAPLLIPHAPLEDDVYEGFHIPKGAIILANAWSMARDESRYPNPHAFIPERFINEGGSLKPNDVEHIAYGFGRRMCPGKHFADTSIWILMARVLAVFKILKPLDENGVEITIEPKFSSGLAVHPLPFECRFVPRDSEMDARKLEDLIAVSTA